jgi:hypothetical protein
LSCPGGKESGLFRYPKEGEAILVIRDEENAYYLLGYLPSETSTENNFLTNPPENRAKETWLPDSIPEPEEAKKTREERNALIKERKALHTEEINALRDEQGIVLRYEQTGKETAPEYDANDTSERYSEIGFYHRPTQWRSTDRSYKDVSSIPQQDTDETDTAYSARLVAAGWLKEDGESDAVHIERVTTAAVFPKIDRVNIQSTGDLYAGAKNHQRLTAKRFELLVDCEPPDHTKGGLSKEELPLGDNVGGDSVLHAGDAHIRTGGRVVIKAGEEIILQVGKTALKISDDSLDIISKIVNSNAPNGYDATVNVSKDGVSIFGQEIDITSYKAFGIGDAFGGSVGGELGVVSIGGREIKAEVYDSTQYAMLMVAASIQYVQSIAAASGSISGNLTASQILEYGEFAYNFLKDLWGLYQSISDVWRDWGEVFRERAVEKAKYADAEEKKKIEEIDAEEAAAKQKAADAAAAEIARIDKEQQEGKCTKEEADKMRADVEAEAAKKTADAEAKAAKGRADAKAETEKIKAEADGIKARQAADDEAESAKTAADTEAEEAKTKADEDAAAAKEAIDAEVEAGNKTRAEADREKAAADRVAQEKKDQADNAAETKKKAAEEIAENKKKEADNEEKQKKTGANNEAKQKKTDAENQAKQKKTDAENQAKQKKTDAAASSGTTTP